jgi:hypothetical protein
MASLSVCCVCGAHWIFKGILLTCPDHEWTRKVIMATSIGEPPQRNMDPMPHKPLSQINLISLLRICQKQEVCQKRRKRGVNPRISPDSAGSDSKPMNLHKENLLRNPAHLLDLLDEALFPGEIFDDTHALQHLIHGVRALHTHTHSRDQFQQKHRVQRIIV